MQAHSTKT
ncbi:hypothetical protein E2C01_100291 [Portunus trituberculatus]|uniref:Uncharacterized protein n=1 Tax=Portunus trituberculatus TaxID=210409 RepID=A0A5B7KJ29_PORTR|nr:hypothetical protein [Portunus trituberculatus]